MTTRDESQKALADMLQGLHQRYQEKLKRPDEFTIREYAEANDISIDKAGLEIENLLKLEAVVYSRKCIDRGKECNAYKFVEDAQ